MIMRRFPPPGPVGRCDPLATREVDFFDFSTAMHIDGICYWNNDLPLSHSGRGGNHVCLSTCYVSCSHLSYDEPWLLDITSTSIAIIGLCSRTECPPRCEDLAEPPHYRPVRRRSRLQVRVVL
jgi:hypothetical protein